MDKSNFIKGNCWYIYDGIGSPHHSTSYSLAAGGIDYLNGNCLGAIFAPSGGEAPIEPLPEKIKTAISKGLEKGLGQFIGGVIAVAMKPC